MAKTVQRLLGHTLALGLVIGSASMAHALPQCDAIHAVNTLAKKNYRTKLPDDMDGAEFCITSTALGGAKTFHCAWQFNFRDPSALNAVRQIDETLRRCLPALEPTTKDQPVNHPDFYDQQEYQLDGIKITLSLKDKGALQQTLVFLAIGG